MAGRISIVRRLSESYMTNTNLPNTPRTLDEQRREFAQRRGLAMPLAGAVAWTIVGVAGAFLPPILKAWVLFGATGSIAAMGIFFSRFTGENLVVGSFEYLWFGRYGSALRASVGRSAEIVAAFCAYFRAGPIFD